MDAIKEFRFKLIAVQVCVLCGEEADAFTSAGLCSLCERKRRSRIQAEAKLRSIPDEPSAKKKAAK